MTSLRNDNSTSSVGIRFCAAFVALNAPHWLVGHWLFISRPIFNVELVIPLLVAGWSLPAAVPTLAMACAFDVAVSQSRSYRFASPQEFLASMRFLGDLHVGQFLSVDRLLIALPFFAFAALGMWLTPRRRIPWPVAFCVVTALSALDVANGSSMAWQPGTRLVTANIANAPAATLAVSAWTKRPSPPLVSVAADASATGAADVATWAGRHPDGSALIVIVESMGLHVDPRLRAWLREQLFDRSMEARYRLMEIAIPFRGSTTSAELRELCTLHGSYQSLDAATGSRCLPAMLAKQGWTTHGLHGFSSHMFDRSQWWPLLGLQNLEFAEDLAMPGGERCGGACAGVCDSVLLEEAVAKAQPPRNLVYALTLNSHLPLSAIEVPADLRDQCRVAGTGDDVCMLTATLGTALRALKVQLARSPQSLEVVVVGDHAPPYGPLSQRNQFDQERVPAFLLTPR